MRIDRLLYEERLSRFGVTDSDLLERAKDFRCARKDLIHEKAVEIREIGRVTIRFAQKVARDVVPFIREIRERLQAAP